MTEDPASGDRVAVLDRELRRVIAMADEAGKAVSPGGQLTVSIPPADGPAPAAFENAAAAAAWYRAERPGLAASARAALEGGLPDRAWALAMALAPVHAQCPVFDDWPEFSDLAVAAAEQSGDPVMLAAALSNRGRLMFRRQEPDRARRDHSDALALYQRAGDRSGVCLSLNALGLISLRARQFPEAAGLFADIAERARREGDSYWENVAWSNMAETQLERGDTELALQALAPLPEVFAGLRHTGHEGNALWLLARARRLAGNPAAALEAVSAALSIADAASNAAWEGWWLIEASLIHLDLGDARQALQCARRSAALHRETGDRSREATALDHAGLALSAAGNAGEAIPLHRQSAGTHRQLGDPWQEAAALARLAGCEQSLGHEDAAREHSAAALALLEQFPDDRAAQIRSRIRARLA